MSSEPFHAALRAFRAELNARFAAAKRRLPELSGDAFGAFFRDVAEPWAEATHGAAPDRTAAVVTAAFEVGLELVGRRLAGPAARSRTLDDGLRRILPAAARVAAADPPRAIGALANALHTLDGTPSARTAGWIEGMASLAPECADLDELLGVGLVLAWRAGLSRFRAGALRVAGTLPEPLARAAVGAEAGARVPEVLARLGADPWHVPGRESVGVRVVRTAGAFRGFGGLFLEPPRLRLCGDTLLVTSAGDAWLLTADAFGASFCRATPEEIAGATAPELPTGFEARGSTLRFGDRDLDLPIAGKITSAAATATTAGVTTALSHAVALVALEAGA